MERSAHVVESCAVTLPRADAAAAAAATQLCDSVASLDAVADALFAGVRLRAGSQRGTCGWHPVWLSARNDNCSVPRPAGGALGTAACRARASRRHSGAEPEGAPSAAVDCRLQLTSVLRDRLRACFGCRATLHRRATWNARCSSATRCACAVRATQRAVRILTGRRAAATRRRKR